MQSRPLFVEREGLRCRLSPHAVSLFSSEILQQVAKRFNQGTGFPFQLLVTRGSFLTGSPIAWTARILAWPLSVISGRAYVSNLSPPYCASSLAEGCGPIVCRWSCRFLAPLYGITHGLRLRASFVHAHCSLMEGQMPYLTSKRLFQRGAVRSLERWASRRARWPSGSRTGGRGSETSRSPRISRCSRRTSGRSFWRTRSCGKR